MMNVYVIREWGVNAKGAFVAVASTLENAKQIAESESKMIGEWQMLDNKVWSRYDKFGYETTINIVEMDEGLEKQVGQR